ncbi:MAG: ABC transporter ATP-binding protein [Planctomycetota bacterium]
MGASAPLLSVHGLSKAFKIGGDVLQVLRDVNLDVNDGEILSVVGRSGSGKSTLLHHIGLLDRPDAGEVRVQGEVLPLEGARAAGARNRFFGFVFQFYHLLPEFSALENVLMPAMIREDAGSWWRQKRELKKRAVSLLDSVGLSGRRRHRPPQLSGGERQRVAIARALMNEPPLLLCDEPTGNLDRQSANSIRDLLWELNRERGQSMVVVTHDASLAQEGHRVMELRDGRVKEFAESS